MMTDPIADMLTRIRNSLLIERPFVDIPASRVKLGIAEALQREGYIWDFEVIEAQPRNILRVNLKYGPNGERVIQTIDRASKPGRRVYSSVRDMPQVLQGLGVSILSTNKGVLSNREARKAGVGGEVLCTVW
ncbi:MAG: 30S ribosomal protein S8 [Planctomycetales bacterium]